MALFRFVGATEVLLVPSSVQDVRERFGVFELDCSCKRC